jgi:glucose dehydrogenase
MATGNWQNTRFSSLAQIDASNADRLALAWTFHTGVLKGQEAAPIVAGGRMYVVSPFPNVLYALDLAKAGTPNVVAWKYEPKPLPAAQGIACCDVVNRGAAVEGGRVFFNTLDGQTCAVDAATGTRAVEDARRRHPDRRDGDHGAARRPRQGVRRQQRR